MKLCLHALLFLLTVVLVSCEGPEVAQAIEARRVAILNEPHGDWFIGRRFYIDRTQFWGYLRRPGQPWEQARLVIMNESKMRAPDRLPEAPQAGPKHGYDHNYEYKIWGHFSGRTVYDPNSDLLLPEFVLTKSELVSSQPGWLFKPRERFKGETLLRWDPVIDEPMRGSRN